MCLKSKSFVARKKHLFWSKCGHRRQRHFLLPFFNGYDLKIISHIFAGRLLTWRTGGIQNNNIMVSNF